MKKIITLVLLGTALLLGGCAIVPSHLGTGLIVSNTSEPMGATSNSKVTRTGTACGTNWFGLVTTGDISIEKAKANARITEVVSVDKDVFTVLGMYSEVCTIVKGN